MASVQRVGRAKLANACTMANLRDASTTSADSLLHLRRELCTALRSSEDACTRVPGAQCDACATTSSVSMRRCTRCGHV